jgi:hypothetical protein
MQFLAYLDTEEQSITDNPSRSQPVPRVKLVNNTEGASSHLNRIQPLLARCQFGEVNESNPGTFGAAV